MIFDEWYKDTIGVTFESAVRQGVSDTQLMKQAFEAWQKAVSTKFFTEHSIGYCGTHGHTAFDDDDCTTCKAIKSEREACAEIANNVSSTINNNWRCCQGTADLIEDTIRARGEK